MEVVYGEEERAVLYFKNPLPEEMSTDIQESAAQHIKKYERKGEIPPIELNNLSESLSRQIQGFQIPFLLKSPTFFAKNS